ncbi:NAD(+) diphosphatase [Methanogenium sp. S4BF]|uniref:NAD(+) diphosphatase n=1 Tax=Methanogenium sp. S4BF TaxID=1789226 RepID=UPI0024169716|nr:NAD(+) diphosphatase [Methanogenium sp. S4BF]WFN33950.1 NAD(+) diphosphatase [Methanogenium sp. S4BF]
MPSPSFSLNLLEIDHSRTLSGSPKWVLVTGGEVLCPEGGSPLLSALPTGIGPAGAIPLGTLNGNTISALSTQMTPDGLSPVSLRDLYFRVDEETLAIGGRAVQLVHFDETSRFCGACGEPAYWKEDELAKVCPRCGGIVYPRLSPAVIVLVRQGREILFVRPPRSPPGRYSLIAGFVEPGETLEHAVMREVAEEAGVSVRNLRYIGSQPWPFPHSLMIGFFAEYAGGGIRPDGVETVDVRWFSPENLPYLPGRMSITDILVEQHLRDDGSAEYAAEPGADEKNSGATLPI